MIVVTTPTGNIGQQILYGILDSGVPVRVIARDPARLPSDIRKYVEVIEGSHGDAGVVERAFEGADSVFWLVPPDSKANSVDAAYVDFTRPTDGADRQKDRGQTAAETHSGIPKCRSDGERVSQPQRGRDPARGTTFASAQQPRARRTRPRARATWTPLRSIRR